MSAEQLTIQAQVLVMVTLTTTWGYQMTVPVPPAIAADISAAQAAQAVVGISRSLSFKGERFERMDTLHTYRPTQPPSSKAEHIRMRKLGQSYAHEYPFTIYAGYGKAPVKSRPAKQAPPAPTIEAMAACYLTVTAAMQLCTHYNLRPPKPGEQLRLHGGCILQRLQDATIVNAWLLRGPQDQVAAMLAGAKIDRPTQGPGPRQYRYAAVGIEQDKAGFHLTRPTNDRAYAEKLVRRWTPFSAPAGRLFGVVLEGVFDRGHHRMTHDEFVALMAARKGADDRTTG